MAKKPGAQCRLTSHLDFANVYQSRQSVRNRSLTACYLNSEHELPRLGLSVSRRIGNAVHRNRVKRILREAFRREVHSLSMPLDIVLIPKSFATASDLAEMTSSLRHLIQRLNKLTNDGELA